MLQAQATDTELPHNLEAERSVLGALFVDREAIIRVRATLQPEDFLRPAHREIYAAIVDLYDRRVAPDQVAVADELERREQLGPDRRYRLPVRPADPDPNRRPCGVVRRHRAA